jgi:hypothetical protein
MALGINTRLVTLKGQQPGYFMSCVSEIKDRGCPSI